MGTKDKKIKQAAPAGMVIMIAPSITYTGTVTGKLIQITDAEAVKMIRGFYTD